MRLSPTVDSLVSAEAARTRRSKGSVVESLVDEALRMRLFPGIAYRGADWDRRPWILGTAFDVWQVVEAHQGLGSLERMTAEGTLGEGQIRIALAYYERFPDEIDEAIALNRRSLDDLRAEYPFIELIADER